MRPKSGFDFIRLAAYALTAACIFGCLKAYKILAERAAAPEPETKALSISEGTLGKEPLYLLLKRNGIKEPQLSAVAAALRKRVNPRELKPKDSYYIAITTAGAFHRLSVTHNLKVHYVAGLPGGRMASGSFDETIFERRRSASGRITSSLWESMIAAGAQPQVIMEFADVFSGDIDFLTETRNDDKYSVIWIDQYTAGGGTMGQRIIAACYDGKETGKKKAFSFEGEYYSEKGEMLRRMFLRAPLSYRRISSYFTKKRMHPILRKFRPHLGIDYVAPSGTPVSAVAHGVVIFTGWKGGFGNYVEIAHENGYVSCYGHLRGYARGTRRGAHIKQGDVVGYVGSTGLSTGPHLDFRIRQNKTYLNFLKLKNRSAGGLAAKKLPRFIEAIKGADAELEHSPGENK